MNTEKRIRLGWLKAMYIATLVIAGGTGLGIIFAPGTAMSMLNISCAPSTYGITGSVFLGFGILSIFGLRDPIKFVPVLFLQLIYKSIWLLGVALPLTLNGQLPSDEVSTVIIFLLVVIGDLIAIPFHSLLSRQKIQ